MLTVVSPLAAGTVLLFYFGWVRTRTEASALGYDSKILEFGTPDYVLRSLNVLSVPLVAVLLGALLLLRAHRWVSASAPGARSRLARIFLLSWLFWLVVCVFLGVFAPAAGTTVVPFALTAAAGLALYGDALRPPGQRWTGAVRLVVAALLVIAVIGDTERLARAMGTGLAGSVAADPGQLAAVTLFSAKDLAIAAPNVTTIRVGGADAAYRFRCTGLRLLQRSGDKYLLINDGWNRDTGRVLLIRDGADVRLEFG